MSLLSPLRHRYSVKQLAIVGLVALAILVVISSTVIWTSTFSPQQKRQTTQISSGFASTTPIALENQHKGTSGWVLTGISNRHGAIDGIPATDFIVGYADRVSASPGDTVQLSISSAIPIIYDLAVYRIGWYQGLGGRLMFVKNNLLSPAQGYWFPSMGMQHCPTCRIDPQTVEVTLNWISTVSLTIGQNWVSGVYLIKLTARNGAESYIPLIVRDDAASSSALVSIAVNTYEAYNGYGGSSLYKIDASIPHPAGYYHALKVTFDRPYAQSTGAGFFTAFDIQGVRWLERMGLDATYTTNVDVSERPELLLTHAIFLSLGHDEYWTKSMYDGIETARDRGVSLAFFGGNDAYWQARYEPNAAGVPDRVLVCYKVVANWSKQYPTDNPTTDPMYRTQPDLVTSHWSDPLLHRPQNELLGVMYLGYFSGSTYKPAWVVSNIHDPFLAGAGLRPGEIVSGGLLGYEVDGVTSPRTMPPGVVLLSQSPVKVCCANVVVTASTAYYRAASGAIVFDAGTIWWDYGLDPLSVIGAEQGNGFKGNSSIQLLTMNILKAMLIASENHMTTGTPGQEAQPTLPPTFLTPAPTPPPDTN